MSMTRTALNELMCWASQQDTNTQAEFAKYYEKVLVKGIDITSVDMLRMIEDFEKQK